jgi:hypothetical protein
VHFDEFIERFNKEYGNDCTWDVVYERVKRTVKELFAAVQHVHPEMHDERVNFKFVYRILFICGAFFLIREKISHDFY